jgi:hypothetical protein
MNMPRDLPPASDGVAKKLVAAVDQAVHGPHDVSFQRWPDEDR